MDSSDALMARFLALHPRTIDLSLGRIERLLALARSAAFPSAGPASTGVPRVASRTCMLRTCAD